MAVRLRIPPYLANPPAMSLPSTLSSLCRNGRLAICALQIAVAGAFASADDAQQLAFFESKIRPLLIANCLECHSSDTEASGGLSLDSREAWLEGGDLGPAIRPGSPEQSLLFRAVSYEDSELEMPPEGKLSAEEIAAIETWIRLGAIDPREAVTHGTSKSKTGLSVAEAASHWSYRPVVVGDGASVDEYIDRRLRANQLEPAGPATSRARLRRLSFDLTGLPPSREDLDEFAADDSADAYAAWVERYLASPRFGEHFARRWMDVARYAESITLRGFVLADAWRYRDYLIQAYNEDRPFNQMVVDQIAGDLLDHGTVREQQMSSVATAFLALGNSNLEDQDKTKLEFDHIDEQLETIGRAFLGQTIGCARCHDHKFDPIPTADYYALAAIFRSTQSLEHANLSQWVRRPLPIADGNEERYEALKADVDEKKKTLAKVEDALKKAKKRAGEGGEREDDQQALGVLKELLQAEVKPLDAELSRWPMYISVRESEPKLEVAIRVRGATHQLGETVPRGFLSAIPPAADYVRQLSSESSGRLSLARWISDPRNPLTARVYVNRVWCWLLGEGLVPTENNFGTTGTPPSHPELLDWLAAEFVASGWSTKHLVRMIARSSAYQRASLGGPELDEMESLRWMARARTKRIPVEALRDAMAAISGTLDHRMGGSEIRAKTKSDYKYAHRSNRRSVYWPVFRNSLPPLFGVFDFGGASISVGQRPESTVPTQALGLANSPWVIEQSQTAAKRLKGELMGSGVDELLDETFLRVLAREPTEAERDHCWEYLRGESGSSDSNDRTTANNPDDRLATVIHALFASIDFRYLD